MVHILNPRTRNAVFEHGVCVLVLMLVLVLVMVLVAVDTGEDEADGGVGRWGDGSRKNESDQGYKKETEDEKDVLLRDKSKAVSCAGKRAWAL